MKNTTLFLSALLITSSLAYPKEPKNPKEKLLEQYQELYKSNREDLGSLATDGSLAAGMLAFSAGVNSFAGRFAEITKNRVQNVSLSLGLVGFTIGILAAVRATIHASYGLHLQRKITQLLDEQTDEMGQASYDESELSETE